jgi:hypothetical protein
MTAAAAATKAATPATAVALGSRFDPHIFEFHPQFLFRDPERKVT